MTLRTQSSARGLHRAVDRAGLNIEHVSDFIERVALLVKSSSLSIELGRADLLRTELRARLFELASDGLAMAFKLLGQFLHGFARLVRSPELFQIRVRQLPIAMQFNPVDLRRFGFDGQVRLALAE